MFVFVCLLATLAAVSSALPSQPQSQHFFSAKFAAARHEAGDLEESPLTQRHFVTRVNHFLPQDARTANFTYTQNLEYFRENGPIFIFVGDGGVYTNEWIEGGLMHDIAASVGAALATADHRYTGANLPTPTASFDDLQHLTVDQALGDLTVLIQTLRADLQTTGRVVLFGTGYGASLAAHARKKFPHLVDAVWASSAYFRSEAIDTTYYDNLSMIIREHGGAECADRVQAAFATFAAVIESAEGEYLQERLGLCHPLDTENAQEVASLTFRFIDTISRYIHFHHLNGLRNFCRDLNALPTDPLNSLARWVEYAYGGGQRDCVTSRYADIVAGLAQTAWPTAESPAAAAGALRTRAIEYIYCTQLGGLKVTSDFALGLFPAGLITAEAQYQLCADVLGEQYNATQLEAAVELLNLSYGGQDQVISHVVFSNAGLDPYIHHGIAEYDIEESAVVFLRYDAAGADLRSASNIDSADLSAAKATIRELITRWSTPSA